MPKIPTQQNYKLFNTKTKYWHTLLPRTNLATNHQAAWNDNYSVTPLNNFLTPIKTLHSLFDTHTKKRTHRLFDTHRKKKENCQIEYRVKTMNQLTEWPYETHAYNLQAPTDAAEKSFKKNIKKIANVRCDVLDRWWDLYVLVFAFLKSVFWYNLVFIGNQTRRIYKTNVS